MNSAAINVHGGLHVWPFKRRELTQFDYDYNAVMVSLRMFPMRWVSNPWPQQLDNPEENIHIWMGRNTCYFYFTRQGRVYGPYNVLKTYTTTWIYTMAAQCRRTMKSNHCAKDGPEWHLWCQFGTVFKDMKDEIERQRGW